MTERDKKIKVLDEIDSMRVVQNNHFMIGEFKDATKVAENIIKLAKEAKLDFIVKEQQDFISQMKKEKAQKDKVSFTMEAFEKTKNRFEKLLKKDDIITAHKEINDFKQKYSKFTNLSSLPSVQELFIKERELWINFMEEQEKIKQELSNFNNKFLKSLKSNDFIDANKILEIVKPQLKDLLDEDIKNKWESHRQEYLKQKENYELCEKVDKAIEESLSLKDSYLFEEALLKIDSTGDLIKDKELIQCKSRLIETRQDIVAAEIKYNKLYLKLAKYKEKFRENKEKRFLIALLRGSEKIIQISQLIGMKEIEKEYKQISEQIKKDLEDIKSFKVKEQEDLMKKAKDIENAIQIEKDVLPLVEEYSVTDFLGDLSNNIKEKLEQIGSLLNENRVEVKKEIVNKLVLTTTSNELIEDETPIAILKSEGGKYNVWSGLINRYEETIEKAIVTDLIPYNFKISEIRLNEELVNELPEKMLTKDGILLKWEFQNITPEDNVKLRYILQRRISRTILFVHNNQLKIIKTHVSLNETEIEGLSEAKLPFTNSFGSAIDGLIIEDIIPLEYLHFVEEPRNIIPEKTDSESGINFRWNVGTMDVGTLNYYHKLLDLSKFEETKKNINKIDKEASEFMRKGLIIEALEKFKEIRNNIRKSIE